MAETEGQGELSSLPGYVDPLSDAYSPPALRAETDRSLWMPVTTAALLPVTLEDSRGLPPQASDITQGTLALSEDTLDTLGDDTVNDLVWGLNKDRMSRNVGNSCAHSAAVGALAFFLLSQGTTADSALESATMMMPPPTDRRGRRVGTDLADEGFLSSHGARLVTPLDYIAHMNSTRGEPLLAPIDATTLGSLQAVLDSAAILFFSTARHYTYAVRMGDALLHGSPDITAEAFLIGAYVPHSAAIPPITREGRAEYIASHSLRVGYYPATFLEASVAPEPHPITPSHTPTSQTTKTQHTHTQGIMQQPQDETPQHRQAFPLTPPHGSRTPRLRQAALSFTREDIPSLLDSVTHTNTLYDTFTAEYLPLSRGGRQRLLLMAGTGEGKTRCGLHVAVDAFLGNIESEKRGAGVRDIVLICVPYIVIAEQYFSRLSRIRVHGERPLLAKMLTSTNITGNTQTIFWKTRAQEEAGGVHLSCRLDRHPEWAADPEDARQTKMRDLWNERYWKTTRFACDAIVGTYEEMCGLLQKIPPELRVSFVFDELQEALMPESSRFQAAYTLAAQLINSKKEGRGVCLTGCASVLDLRDDGGIFSPLLSELAVVKYESLPKLLSVRAQQFTVMRAGTRYKRPARELCTMIDSFMDTMLKPSGAQIPTLLALLGDATNYGRDGWESAWLSANMDAVQRCMRKCEEDYSPLIVCAAHIIKYSQGQHPGTFIIMCNAKEKAVTIELILLAVTKLFCVATGAPPPTTFSPMKLSSWHAKGSAEMHPGNEKPPQGVRPIRDSVMGSETVTRRVRENIRKIGRSRAERENLTLTAFFPSLKEDGAFSVEEVKTMDDVRVAAALMFIWRSNADVNWEDECMREFARVGECPPVIIATQKIAIGADLPNIRGVVMLSYSARAKYSNELIEQVVGRVDRERVSRFVFVEQQVGKGSLADSAWRSNEAIINMLVTRDIREAATRRALQDTAIVDVLVEFVSVIGQTELVRGRKEAKGVKHRRDSVASTLRQRAVTVAVGEREVKVDAEKLQEFAEDHDAWMEQIRVMPPSQHVIEFVPMAQLTDFAAPSMPAHAIEVNCSLSLAAKTQLGVQDPRLDMLFPLGVPDIQAQPGASAQQQTARDIAHMFMTQAGIADALVTLPALREGSFFSHDALEIHLARPEFRGSKFYSPSGTPAQDMEALRSTLSLTGRDGVEETLKSAELMPLADYTSLLADIAQHTPRTDDLLFLTAFLLACIGALKLERRPTPENAIAASDIEATNTRLAQEERAFLSFDVDVAGLIRDCEFILPGTSAAYFERQSMRQAPNKEGLLIAPSSMAIVATVAQGMFEKQTALPTYAALVATRVTAALKQRKLMHIAYANASIHTLSTQKYITDFLACVDKFAGRAQAIDTRSPGSTADAALLLSPAAVFLMSACRRIQAQLLATVPEWTNKDAVTALAQALAQAGIQRFSAAQSEQEMRQALGSTPVAAHPFFHTQPGYRIPQGTADEYYQSWSAVRRDGEASEQ